MPSYFCLICHLNHLNLHLMYLIKCIKTISQPSQISFFFVFLLCVFLRDLFKVPTHKEPGRPLKHALMVSKFLQGWTNVNADDVVKLMYEHHDSTPKAASTTTACPGHSQSALCCLPANDWPVFFFCKHMSLCYLRSTQSCWNLYIVLNSWEAVTKAHTVHATHCTQCGTFMGIPADI